MKKLILTTLKMNLAILFILPLIIAPSILIFLVTARYLNLDEKTALQILIKAGNILAAVIVFISSAIFGLNLIAYEAEK